MHNITVQHIFDTKHQYHERNALIPFEEKVLQIIELQKIDMEFNKQRKLPRAPYMRVWKIEVSSEQ